MTESEQVITGYRVKTHAAEVLQKKALEVTLKRQQITKESEIIDFILEKCAHLVRVDKNGKMYLDAEKL